MQTKLGEQNTLLLSDYHSTNYYIHIYLFSKIKISMSNKSTKLSSKIKPVSKILQLQ